MAPDRHVRHGIVSSARGKPVASEPVDSDIDTRRGLRLHSELRVVFVVMIGGIGGAVGRYSATLWSPTAAAGFPWTTFGINVVGSMLLAAVVVLSTECWPDTTMLRPLLGTGVLGGFTTFSTFSVDQRRLLADGHAGTAIVYLVATLAGCTAATWAGQLVTHAVLKRGQR